MINCATDAKRRGTHRQLQQPCVRRPGIDCIALVRSAAATFENPRLRERLELSAGPTNSAPRRPFDPRAAVVRVRRLTQCSQRAPVRLGAPLGGAWASMI